MTADLTQAILDWRNTNGTGPTVTYYAMQQPSYQCKCDLFETVDELRLLYGADMDTLQAIGIRNTSISTVDEK